MVEYERRVGPAAQKGVTLRGKKCDMCGYTQLDSDDDVWSAVGL
jgi:hypothetical protein